MVYWSPVNGVLENSTEHSKRPSALLPQPHFGRRKGNQWNTTHDSLQRTIGNEPRYKITSNNSSLYYDNARPVESCIPKDEIHPMAMEIVIKVSRVAMELSTRDAFTICAAMLAHRPILASNPIAVVRNDVGKHCRHRVGRISKDASFNKTLRRCWFACIQRVLTSIWIDCLKIIYTEVIEDIHKYLLADTSK